MKLLVGLATVALISAGLGGSPSTANSDVGESPRALQFAGGPDVVPTAIASAPWVVATGRSVTLAATVRAKERGGVVRVGLVFTSGQQMRHGTLLGKPHRLTVKAHHGAHLKLTGRIPQSLSGVGQIAVCVNPKPTLVRNSCLFARGVVGISPSRDAAALIDAAHRAGHVSDADVPLFELYAVVGDKRLPKILRGTVHDDPHDSLVRLAASDGGKAQNAALPYFTPPAASHNGWAFPQQAAVRQEALAGPTDNAVTPDCRGFETKAEPPSNDVYAKKWKSVATSDGHALVWYVQVTAKDPSNPTQVGNAADWTADDLGYATEYANAMPHIWSSLTAVFGEPQSDAAEPCYHGPDGRLDIYVSANVRSSGGQTSFDSLPAGVTLPYPAVGNYPAQGQFCTDRPSFVVLAGGREPFVLAHEFMHVVQFSHRYATCKEPTAFWDEGSADWAADYAYPDSQYELANHYFMLHSPTAFSSPTHTSYEYWPFWMMLHRTAGIDVLKSVFAQLKTKQAIPAVGAAIPGGWAKQLPRLALTVWNQDPIGASGWTIDQGFKDWDDWTGKPTVSKVVEANLGGAAQRILALPPTPTNLETSFEALSIGAIQEVDVTDPDVREIQFSNALAGKPAHVDAMIQGDDGTWRLEDWSGKSKVTLCLDDADQDVQKFVVLSTNISAHDLPKFTHKIRLRSACSPPDGYVGTFDGTRHEFDSVVDDSQSWHATVEFTFSDASDDYVNYFAKSGNADWSGTQTIGQCSASASQSYPMGTDSWDTGHHLKITTFFGGQHHRVGPDDPYEAGIIISEDGISTTLHCPDSDTSFTYWPSGVWLCTWGCVVDAAVHKIGSDGALDGTETSTTDEGQGTTLVETWTWHLTPVYNDGNPKRRARPATSAGP